MSNTTRQGNDSADPVVRATRRIRLQLAEIADYEANMPRHHGAPHPARVRRESIQRNKRDHGTEEIDGHQVQVTTCLLMACASLLHTWTVTRPNGRTFQFATFENVYGRRLPKRWPRPEFPGLPGSATSIN